MLNRLPGNLRHHGAPVSLREYLDLPSGRAADMPVDGFYHFARAAPVKDESHIDSFDRAFFQSFSGMDEVPPEAVINATDMPQDRLEKLAEKTLGEEEKAAIAGSAGFTSLVKKLREWLAEQLKRHQGGNKWIGTARTSPLGAYDDSPKGGRIGQSESRHYKAVVVWDNRDFRDFDVSVALGARNIKVALKRLRQWTRHIAHDGEDQSATNHATSNNGYIDVKTRPERYSAVKMLLFLDVGDSMDDHVRIVDGLLSTAWAEFKHLHQFYFHNCLHETLRTDNRRCWSRTTPTRDILHRFRRDYKAILAGDASISISPYDIVVSGGANEHWSDEAGHVWLDRAREALPDHVWLNPVAQGCWMYTQFIGIIGEVFKDRMKPMTLWGPTDAMKVLG